MRRKEAWNAEHGGGDAANEAGLGGVSGNNVGLEPAKGENHLQQTDRIEQWVDGFLQRWNFYDRDTGGTKLRGEQALRRSKHHGAVVTLCDETDCEVAHVGFGAAEGRASGNELNNLHRGKGEAA
jgi:hypothetical protein